MIENQLTDYELSNFLAPVLSLKSVDETIHSFEKLFGIEIAHIDDLYKYFYRFRVVYEGFSIFIRDIKKNEEDHIHLQLDFRIKKRWWHQWFNPEKKVVKAIQDICKKEISNLSFSTYRHSTFEISNFTRREIISYFYYDSDAFNKPDGEDGRRVSPLVIVESQNEKYRFVEFNFSALSYEKKDSKVELKSSWRKFMYY